MKITHSYFDEFRSVKQWSYTTRNIIFYRTNMNRGSCIAIYTIFATELTKKN